MNLLLLKGRERLILRQFTSESAPVQRGIKKATHLLGVELKRYEPKREFNRAEELFLPLRKLCELRTESEDQQDKFIDFCRAHLGTRLRNLRVNGFEFDKYDIHAITVAHNYSNSRTHIYRLLTDKAYQRMV